MMMARCLFLALLLSCWSAHAWTVLRKSSISASDQSLLNRRDALLPIFTTLFPLTVAASAASSYSGPTIDVNNAMAREFTAFPGLYPTIATKIVNGAKRDAYTSKKDVYAVLDSDLEKDRLKQYDSAIIINKPDAAIRQFKASQICKYECGSRVSNPYRDEQIKAVQSDRLYK